MSSVDSRIVELKFNTSDFERGVRRTQENMKKLDSSLKLEGVASNVENIASKFSPLGAIAFTTLQRMTNSAIDFGLKIGRAVTDPLIEGGRRRAMSIEQAKFQFEGLGMDVEQAMDDALYAVKGTAFGLDEAAMAASMFGASGVESGEEMKEALRGISGVAAMSGSSYTDMANVFTKVAGQGRLMGDDLNRLGTRGINAAATLAEYFNKTGEVVGATEADIREMVTKGEIDFNTFAAAMSDAFGEHATKASETFTGALANMNAALARIGEMGWAPHLERMRKLYNALTPVIDGMAHALEPFIKGLSDLVDMSFDNIVNFLDNLGFEDLTDDFTPPIVEGIMSILDTVLSIVKPIQQAWQDVFPPMAAENVAKIGDAVKAFADSIKPAESTLNNLQRTFRGFFSIIGIGWEVLKAVTNGIFAFIGAISGGTGPILKITGSIGDWIFKLYEAIKAGDGLTDFFVLLGEIIAAPIKFIMDMASGVGDLGESIGNVIGTIGDFIRDLFGVSEGTSEASSAIDKHSDKIESLGSIGKIVSGIWGGLVAIFGSIGSVLGSAFSTIGDVFAAILDPLKEAFESDGLTGILDIINTGVLALVGKSIYDFFKGLTTASQDSGGITAGIKEIFGGVTSSLETLQNTLKAQTLLTIAGAIAVLAGAIFLLSTIDGADMTKSLTGMAVIFAQLMTGMSLFQKVIDKGGFIKLPIVAAGLILVSIAILTLSAAVKNMADLDWNGLAKGLTGVVVLLGSIAGFMHIMPSGGKGLISAGIGMTIMAGALLILQKAVTKFADMTWGEMVRGLTGVAMGLVAIAGAMHLMPAKGMITTGIGLVVVASSLLILASAVSKFSALSWDEIGRGLTAMAGGLVLMAGAMRIMPKGMIGQAIALTILGGALHIIGDAMSIFAGFSWGEIGTGLVAMGGGLALIAGAMHLMPKNMILVGAGLVVVGHALSIISEVMVDLGGMSWEEIARSLVVLAGALATIAGAMYLMTGAVVGAASMVIIAYALSMLVPTLVSFGEMSWEEIAKAMVVLAGSLALLAGGMYLMTAALPGAAALFVVSMALGMLAPVLQTLGGMSWGEIGKGLATLAGTLAVIGLAGALIGPVVPALLGLGGAILLLGAGAALAGLGLMSLASGLAMIAAIGAGGTAVLIATLSSLIEMIPKVMTAVARGIVGAVVALAEGASEMMAAVKTLILELLVSLSEIIPAIIDFGVELVTSFLEGLESVFPEILSTGIEIVLQILEGLADAMPEIVEYGTIIIEEFLEGLDNVMPQLIDAGIEFIGMFIEGIGRNASKLVGLISELVVAILDAIGEFAGDILEAGFGIIESLLEGIGEGISDVIGAIVDMIVDIIEAIGEGASEIIVAGFELIEALLEGIGEGVTLVIEAVADLIVDIIEALGDAAGDVMTAGGDLVEALVEGMTEQIVKVADAITEAIVTLLTTIEENSGKVIEAGTSLIVSLIEGISESSSDIVSAGADAIVDFMDGLAEEIPRIAESAVDLVVTFTTELGSMVGELADAGFQLIIDVLDGLTEAIESNAETLHDSAKALGNAVIEGLMPGVTEKWDDLKTTISETVENVLTWFKDLFGIDGGSSSETESIGEDVVDGLEEGVDSKGGEGSSLWTKVTNVAKNVLEWFRDIFSTHSPSEETRNIGTDVIDGLEEGIGSGEGEGSSLGNMVTSVAQNVLSWFGSIFGTKGGPSSKTRVMGSGLIGGIIGGISSSSPNLSKGVGTVSKNAVGAFATGLGVRGGVSTKTAPMGKALTGGIQSGANQGVRTLGTAIAGVSTGAINRFQSSLGARGAASTKTLGMGKSLTEGVRKGINSNQRTLTNMINSMGRSVMNLMKNTLSATKTRPYGTAMVFGLRAGLVSSRNTLTNSARAVGMGAVNTLRNVLSVAAGASAGRNIAIGLVRGIQGGSYMVTAAARTMARNALSAAKNALGIASPSKEFGRLGSWSVDGYKKGIEDNKHKAKDAGSSVAKSAISGAKETLGKANLRSAVTIGTIVDKIDREPVIRPILDNDALAKDVKKLPSIMPDVFTAGVSYSQASSIAATSRQNGNNSDDSKTHSTTQNVSYVQNNYSPEPIKEKDVYRQTKSLISIKNGGVDVS